MFRKRLISQVFFSNASRILLKLMWPEVVQNFGFFGKRDVFLRKNNWKLSKTLNTYTLFGRPFKSYYCLCNLQTSKIWVFSKKWRFFRKNPWKTSEALFGMLYRECVWHFHIASEFSKQLNFWVFGELDVVFEEILLFLRNR